MMDNYYDDYEHISQSMLKVLAESPAKFHAQFIAQTMTQPETEAMRFGRKFHSAVLEPDDFCKRYVVPPKLDRRTTDGKKRWAEWCAEHKGCEAIEADELLTLTAMQQAILGHKDARNLWAAVGEVEKPIRWEDRVKRKAKLDKIIPSMGIIPDFKTIADPSPRGFASAAAKWGWYLQASWYKDAAWHETGDDYRFVFICVGKEPPHEVALYELTDDDAEWSDVRTEQLVTELIIRQEKNDWLADWQQGDPLQIALPAWIRSTYYETDGEKWQLQLPPETA
jgi:exodeoxyribonuclease VIII